MPQNGSRYKWNDKEGDKRIYSKIDWVFVNRVWLDQMPVYTTTFLPEGVSDHCPISIRMANILCTRRRSFQYCNTWSQHPEFHAKVREVWHKQIEGCMMFQIVKKMKLLKQNLKEVNKNQCSNIIKEETDDREALEQAQIAMQLRPGDQALQLLEKEKYQKFRQSSYLAEIFLQQRSKATWLRLGDDDTKYIFSIIKHKRLQQEITQLMDKDDVIQTNPRVIASILVDFYKDFPGKRKLRELELSKASYIMVTY